MTGKTRTPFTTIEGMEASVTVLLRAVGENPDRGGLVETPHRFCKALMDMTSGYAQSPADVLKCFEDGAENYNELVIVRDIPFYSMCEHHMAPFFGTATIGYLPNGKVVGLSKLSRLLDVFARRLQVQERLTAQVADALMEHLECDGAGVLIQARHLCMEARGVQKQGSTTATSALRGVLYENSPARAEFLALAKV